MSEGRELAVRAIIVKDGRLLVMKRNKFGKKYFALPGGGVEDNETPEQAVVRELKEEACLSVETVRKVYKQKPLLNYPTQYIYLCEAKTAKDPELDRKSIEYKLNKTGNKYKPVYMAIGEIQISPEPFLPEILFDEIKLAVNNNFPTKTKTIG